MIVSGEIKKFRERMLENNRHEDVCRKWDDLAEEDHTYRRMSESEYSRQAKLVDLSQQVRKPLQNL